MSGTHIIRRLLLNVELFGTEQEGLAVNGRLSALCHDRLQRTLEQMLDRYAPTDAHVFVPLLEVDLGAISLDRLEEQVSDAIRAAVGDALRALPAADLKGHGRGDPLSDTVRHRSDRHASIDAFLHFVRTGQLPWWFHLADGMTFEAT